MGLQKPWKFYLIKTGGSFSRGFFYFVASGLFLSALLGMVEFYFFRVTVMITKSDGDINLRVCPGKRVECPSKAKIPPNTSILAHREVVLYTQLNGSQARWRKIEYQGDLGWVNEANLRLAN